MGRITLRIVVAVAIVLGLALPGVALSQTAPTSTPAGAGARQYPQSVLGSVGTDQYGGEPGQASQNGPGFILPAGEDFCSLYMGMCREYDPSSETLVDVDHGLNGPEDFDSCDGERCYLYGSNGKAFMWFDSSGNVGSGGEDPAPLSDFDYTDSDATYLISPNGTTYVIAASGKGGGPEDAIPDHPNTGQEGAVPGGGRLSPPAQNPQQGSTQNAVPGAGQSALQALEGFTKALRQNSEDGARPAFAEERGGSRVQDEPSGAGGANSGGAGSESAGSEKAWGDEGNGSGVGEKADGNGGGDGVDGEAASEEVASAARGGEKEAPARSGSGGEGLRGTHGDGRAAGSERGDGSVRDSRGPKDARVEGAFTAPLSRNVPATVWVLAGTAGAAAVGLLVLRVIRA